MFCSVTQVIGIQLIVEIIDHAAHLFVLVLLCQLGFNVLLALLTVIVATRVTLGSHTIMAGVLHLQIIPIIVNFRKYKRYRIRTVLGTSDPSRTILHRLLR